MTEVRPSPPTMFERAEAARSRLALLTFWPEPQAWGQPETLHIDMSQPRRGVWIIRWENLPGLRNVNGKWQHDSLPGWEYSREEVTTEMIPDLEALSLRGERPTQVTTPRQEAACVHPHRPAIAKPTLRPGRRVVRDGTPELPGLFPREE